MRPAVVPKRDLALGRPAIASSEQLADTPASNAFDGDDDTRWSSDFSDPQWICVDLGQVTTVGSVSLTWETAYASAYKIQVSLDNRKWTDVSTTATGGGGVEDVTFAPTPARWVRLYGTKRATEWGYSLYSFQVFGAAAH